MHGTSPAAAAPLAGIRVVELANFVSGPFAGMMLGDLGAEVIKVESGVGDPLRRFGRSGAPLSPLFVNTNRGKRSVALDLKTHDGRHALRSLLATADVLICNWRPSVAPRLGVDDDELARANPGLVRVYVTGFGADGPLAGTPTYDSVVQAHLGSADGADEVTPPSFAGTYVVDKTAATMVAQAVLAALVSRERGGPAPRIDLSLLDAAAYVNFPDLMVNRTFVDRAPAEARNRQAAAARALRARDGWLVVVPVTADQIRRAFEVVGAPEVAAELLAMTDATDLTVRMLDALEARTRTGTVANWVSAFVAADVPAGPCLTLDEHLVDEQVRHNGTYGIVSWPGLGAVRYVRYPARFSTFTAPSDPGPPPAVGEHDAGLLTEVEA